MYIEISEITVVEIVVSIQTLSDHFDMLSDPEKVWVRHLAEYYLMLI
jgi:hypothetical protein